MEFETFFHTAIATNAIISSALAVSARNVGMSGHWGWRISHTIMLLIQVRLMYFLGAPMGEDGPSAIGMFPTQFGLLFWMLAASVALVALSLRRNSQSGSTSSWRYGWRGVILIALTLICAGFSVYGTFLLLREPKTHYFSDIVTEYRSP